MNEFTKPERSISTYDVSAVDISCDGRMNDQTNGDKNDHRTDQCCVIL